MRTIRIAIAAGVVVITTVSGIAVAYSSSSSDDPPSEMRQEADFTRDHLDAAAVSRADAERAAAGRHEGTISDTHLEDEEGQGLRWEVKVDDGQTLWEVQVDARSGSVVSDQPDD